jgi:hypothetical protein
LKGGFSNAMLELLKGWCSTSIRIGNLGDDWIVERDFLDVIIQS